MSSKPIDDSIKGMMTHLKLSPYINLSFKNNYPGTTTVKDVIDLLKTKQWDNLLTNTQVVFYKENSEIPEDFIEIQGKIITQ